MRERPLSWLSIVRLGLVQAALGSIIVLTTSTLNRVMVVELGLAAVIPGMLVGIHYGVQLARPLWGHGSDSGGRRSRWIIGGVGLLALAGTGAALATAIMTANLAVGLALAILDFVLIGIGVGAAGTSLLALLASSVAPGRRAAAATLVWLMMIFGIAVTAIVTGRFLDPFSMQRLIDVTAATGLAAFVLSLVAVVGVETASASAHRPRQGITKISFRSSLADAWSDPQARLFTLFVFMSMLGYSMQDLILEPFAGLAFAMPPGETTALSGLQNGGVFAGMVIVGLGGNLLSHRYPTLLKGACIAGCGLSAAALGLLAVAAGAAPDWPLAANVVALGFANGVFAVAAIAMMMALAGTAGPSRIGLRMGLWGAAQAIAFGLGGVTGTVMADLLRLVAPTLALAYGGVFLVEALVFMAAAAIAWRITPTRVARGEADVTGGLGIGGASFLQAAE